MTYGMTKGFTEEAWVLRDKTFPGEILHTCLLIPDRKHTTDPSTYTTEVQLGDQ